MVSKAGRPRCFGGLFRPLVLLLAAGICGCEREEGPALTLDLGSGAKIEFVRIPPGEFAMGSPEDEAERDASEGPRHNVRIARPFYLGKYEVTQAQWEAIIGSNQSQLKGDIDLPADSVSWGDCQKFCKYASEKTGRKFRLPTEAEWEFACRAGTTTPFATGPALSASQANISGEEPHAPGAKGVGSGKTVKVGSYAPNVWGLYDMHGNVWEWCEDAFVDSYEKAPADGQEAVKPGADAKPEDIAFVYRGGSYKNAAAECRSAIRYAAPENQRTEAVGFRVVVEMK